MRGVLRVRASALAFAPSLLVVLATLWARNPRTYFATLAPGGVVEWTAVVALVGATVLALWNLRACAGAGRPRARASFLAVAAGCAAGAVALARSQSVVRQHRWVADLLHGHVATQADLLAAVIAAVLVLSPIVRRFAPSSVVWALPPVLIPAALLGLLASADRPSGCEAAVAHLALAATLLLWMLVELVEARSTTSEAGTGRATGDEGRRPIWWSSERAGLLLGVSLCCAVAVWATWPSWRPGMLLSADAPRHLLRTRIMAELFLPSGHVDGWSPYWYLGAQLFLFQSYGYFAVMGAACVLLHRWVSLLDVFKLFYALPILVLPLAVSWLARGLGASRRASLAAAFASLLLGSGVGYGLRGVYGTGLLPQGVGVVLAALLWPVLLDALDGTKGAVWKSGLLLGVTLVTHFITGAYTLVAAAAVAAGTALWRRDAAVPARYAGMAILAILLSAHALFPSIELYDMAGAPVGWGASQERFFRFLAGHGVGPAWLVWPAFAAAAVAIARGRGRLAIAALVLFATAVAASSTPWEQEPVLLRKFLRVVVRPRAMPYAVLMTAVFAGVAFDALLARVRAGEHAAASAPEAPRWPWREAVAVVLCVALVSAGLAHLASARSVISTQADLRTRKDNDYTNMVQWLRRNVEKPAVVAVDRHSLPAKLTGTRSVISPLNLDTGLFTLGGDQAELTRAASRARLLVRHQPGRPPTLSARRLRSYAVSYVIATAPGLRRGLGRDPDFRRVYRNSSASVFRVRDSGAWLTGTSVTSRRLRVEPEHMRWHVSVQGARPRAVTAAVSWHPDWVARVDGREVPLESASEWLIRFEVPSGEHEVELVYVRRGAERLYDAISLIALLATAAGLARTRRRGRSPAFP